MPSVVSWAVNAMVFERGGSITRLVRIGLNQVSWPTTRQACGSWTTTRPSVSISIGCKDNSREARGTQRVTHAQHGTCFRVQIRPCGFVTRPGTPSGLRPGLAWTSAIGDEYRSATMIKVAINGLGRIGRAAFRIVLNTPELVLTAVNDLTPHRELAYLLNYDSIYGRSRKTVRALTDRLVVEGTTCRVFSEKEPEKLPWGKLGIDVVLECTGALNTKVELEQHIKAGAKYVVLSAPAKTDDVPTVVHRVNAPPVRQASIISCASCTPTVLHPLSRLWEGESGCRRPC